MASPTRPLDGLDCALEEWSNSSNRTKSSPRWSDDAFAETRGSIRWTVSESYNCFHVASAAERDQGGV